MTTSGGDRLLVRSYSTLHNDFIRLRADEYPLWSAARHPNLERFLATRDFERDLQPFLAFYYELQPGWDLLRLLFAAARRDESIPLPIASAIVADVLLGVHAIHTATTPTGKPLGMVHQNIGPTSVLVQTSGTALLRCPDPSGFPLPTGCAGQAAVIGPLPRYLTPEQVRATRQDLRVDLYACSALLWELLTNRRPLDADTSIQRLYRIIQEEEAPPSAHRPGISSGLDRLVMTGLAKAPEARFPSAAVMLEKLLEQVSPASPGEVAAWARKLGVPTLEEELGGPPPLDLYPEELQAWAPSGAPYRETSTQPAPPPPPSLPVPTGKTETRAWRWAAMATVVALALVALGLGLPK